MPYLILLAALSGRRAHPLRKHRTRRLRGRRRAISRKMMGC